MLDLPRQLTAVVNGQPPDAETLAGEMARHCVTCLHPDAEPPEQESPRRMSDGRHRWRRWLTMFGRECWRREGLGRGARIITAWLRPSWKEYRRRPLPRHLRWMYLPYRVIRHTTDFMPYPSLLITALASIVAGLAARHHPGSPWPFWSVHVASVAFTWLGFRPPYRYGVMALASFFALGFWLKLMVHLLTGAHFVEPIGRFDGSPEQWDRALTLIAAALLGAAAARALDMWWTRRTMIATQMSATATAGDWPAPEPRVPMLFVQHRRAVWLATAMLTVAVVVANLFGAFLMIGVDMRILLPFRLHVVVAFWLLFGSSAWLALVLTWERAVSGALQPAWVLAAAGEGLVASISMLSRSVYVFRLIPYLLVLLTRGDIIRRPSWPQATAGMMLLASGLVASVGSSMFTRAFIYPAVIMPPLRTASANTAPGAPAGVRGSSDGVAATPDAALGAATADSRRDGERMSSRGADARPSHDSDSPDLPHAGQSTAASGAAKSAEEHEQALRSQRLQVPNLILARWIGLEGVLATSSHPARGPRLFHVLLTDNPANGVNTYYQRVSRAEYAKQEGFTFLTLAGVVGILASSGTPIVTGLGLFVVAGLLILLDVLAARMTRSVLVAASVGVGAANIVAQMNFPYNTAVLGIELTMMLIGVGVILRWLPAWRAPSPDSSRESRT